MMRIPGFQAAIFPPESMPTLKLVANLGLILFLFLVALEVDMRLFYSNWRVALSVGLAGMLVPFGLGCAIAYGLYHAFRSDPGLEPISFGVYMLFIGTALAITAFPVLCRILTELKILSTPVGVTVLAAGVGNDVTGWILLALCVALVNQASGITALYVLLCAVGWILFLVYAIRPCFLWCLRKTGSIQNGPTQGMVALTLLLTLTSAWFTGIIGVHPIFGGFLVGLICPHDGGFAIKLTEKIEDIVTVLFLPLYFALSGLSTNLGLLDDGKTWGYVVAVIVIAFVGKIVGGTLAARACRLVWRESLTIGVLMSCKGLVELIVLNIGLQARILSTRTFTMFVVMALVTTVATTPLTALLYPPWYQKKLEAWKRGEIDWDGNRLLPEKGSETGSEKLQETFFRRFLVCLRLDSLPSLFTFVSLVGDESNPFKHGLQVHGLRMLELTERTSSVMRSSEADDYATHDPIVSAFRTFAQLNSVAVSGNVSVVPESSYAETIAGKVTDMSSDLVLIPWSESGTISEGDQLNLYDYNSSQDRFSNGPQMNFVQSVLDTARCTTVVFVNHGLTDIQNLESRSLRRTASGLSIHRDLRVSPARDTKRHIFFPYFGGPDDYAAAHLVVQLAHNSNITVTVMQVTSSTTSDEGQSPSTEDSTFISALRTCLNPKVQSRVSFIESSTDANASAWFSQTDVCGQIPQAGDLIVVGRRKGSQESHLARQPNMTAGPELRRTLGSMAECAIFARVKASILVVQAQVPRSG
jgi:Kef-type K+ transport system membrane component KefB